MLQDILTVFIRVDSTTARERIEQVDLHHVEDIKRFTRSFLKQNSHFHALLLGLTAGMKKETVVGIFADYWKDLTRKQLFRLKWEEFRELLESVSRPNVLGRLKLFEAVFALINRQYSKLNKLGFLAKGLDCPTGSSMLVMLRKALLGGHNYVKWPVSAR